MGKAAVIKENEMKLIMKKQRNVNTTAKKKGKRNHKLNKYILELEAENKLLKGFIKMALDELGVPTKDYPAPVSNAVNFLNEALKV